ncbi:hypothetical protein QN277_007051 [Acacia crassicarpa]|uniref:Nodulin-like domain-containing protein n=1 Tax=Acacia crassicarpa TaxID=499986 RepID=A0AAE1MCI8_9FABA|nr:hypothetical protein QN277_007051 [Acacia crassicarpa]
MADLKGGTRPPWVGLGAAVWFQVAAGNSYGFPLYSHSLRSVLGFSQLQIALLGVANDIGESVGVLPGIASNKFPPWLILSVGALHSFVGYGVLWLSVSRTLPSLPYWLLWIASVVATNGATWLATPVLVTNMRNFPANRGTVAGILKGYLGLSATVFTVVYSLVLHNSSTKFLLFLALGIPVTCFALMFLVRPCTPASGEDPSENGHFVFVQASSIVLGLYLLATTVIGDAVSLSGVASYALVFVMILLLMAPLAVPIKMTLFPRKAIKPEAPELQAGSSEHDEKSEPLLIPVSSSSGMLGSFNDNDESSEVAMLLAVGEGAVNKKKRRPKRGEDFNFREAVIKADFWLLFLVFFVGVGTGVTVVNNLAQIGIAQGVENTTILLSTFGFCNFVGRLGGGIVSEHFVRTKTIPRTVWFICTQMIMIILYLLFANAVSGTLYPAIAFLGICFGVQFSVLIPTVSELFGLRHFGVIYNFMCLGNPLGAFLFSALLASHVYDAEAAKQHGLSHLVHDSITKACVGPSCFRLTFLVLAGVSAVGSLLSIILTVRVKPVYQMLYASGSFRHPQSSSSH